jgi:Skp family chaperone for outer membrane proteins
MANMKIFKNLVIVAFLFLLFSCATKHTVEVEPVEVKPIHITIDVNVKVDRALDDFFNEIDEAENKIEKDIETSKE